MFTLLRKLFSPIKISESFNRKKNNFTEYYDYYEINGGA